MVWTRFYCSLLQMFHPAQWIHLASPWDFSEWMVLLGEQPLKTGLWHSLGACSRLGKWSIADTPTGLRNMRECFWGATWSHVMCCGAKVILCITDGSRTKKFCTSHDRINSLCQIQLSYTGFMRMKSTFVLFTTANLPSVFARSMTFYLLKVLHVQTTNTQTQIKSGNPSAIIWNQPHLGQQVMLRALQWSQQISR